MQAIQLSEDFERCIQKSVVYVKPDTPKLSKRKLDSLLRIAELQKYYQRNPVKFISDFFNIELLDFQRWVLQMAWTCPNVLLLMSRGEGKSLLICLLMMAKGMLFNNYWTYIASGSGAQAQQTFETLEKLANDNIPTIVNSSGYIFKNELIVPNANGDGFSHSADGYKYTLQNFSQTVTLNSNIDKRRGIAQLLLSILKI